MPTLVGVTLAPVDSAAVEALLRAYPGSFAGAGGAAAAQAFVGARRELLAGRCGGRADVPLAVSSGCAASGAHTHARMLADQGAHALARLDAGLAPWCERCDGLLPLERLEAAPAAVRCTACAPSGGVDTRWCR